MSTQQQVKPSTQKRESPVGPLVNTILTFFYVLMILNLIYVTWSAVANTDNGDYSYLLPIGLYAVLFPVYFVLNYVQYRQQGGTLSDLLWGYDETPWRPFVFVLLGYFLISWASSISPAFVWLYVPWISATFGLVAWYVAFPLMACGVIALLWQSGLLAVVGTGDLPPSALMGIGLGTASTASMIIMITLLIRSQIKSRILVADLRETKAQLEAAHDREKEVAVLRERDRMAREMHDVLGHALVLVAVKIEAAQRLSTVDPERAAQELEATKELVRSSMTDLRSSLANLRRSAHDGQDKPLDAALRSWAERTARESNFNIEFNISVDAGTLPAAVQDALWRVGRESVMNIVKHARASNVQLSIFAKGDSVYLTVLDDGVGIPHLAEGSARLEVEGHYGVRGMRERIESLGGQLRLTTGREGRGTLVTAQVPLPEGSGMMERQTKEGSTNE